MGAGLGDAELEEDTAFSEGPGKGFREDVGIDGGGMFLESEVGGRDDPGRGDAPSGGSTREGEAESGGALNGWKETEGRRATAAPSPARTAARPTGLTLPGGTARRDDESDGAWDAASVSPAARRAEIGLAPVVGPTWWKLDRLP